MTFSHLKLSLRLLLRDARSGHLNLILMALLVAVTTHNTIGFLTERVKNAMELQATNILGGDLVVRAPQEQPHWLDIPEGIQSAYFAEFATVILSEDGMQLSSIKAVSDHYPMKAKLRIADAPFANDYPIDRGPSPGNAWIESRLLSILNLQIGDSIEVGDKALTIEKVLTFEPDPGGNFYTFVPRLMMHADDLAATQVVQPGSRVDYFYQYVGSPEKISALKAQIEPTLKPGEQILSIESQQRSVSAALNRAQDYLKLASLMAVILAAVALAMGARFFCESRFDMAALLRCFGLQANQILGIFFFQLLSLGLLAGIVGGALGWALHFVTIELLTGLLPNNIPLPSFAPFLSGCALALFILVGFSLPPLIQLRHTPPLRVLRRALSPAPLSAWLTYAIVIVVLGVLLMAYLKDIVFIGMAIIGSLAAWILTYILSLIFRRILRIVSRYSSLPVRVGLRNLDRRQASTRMQLLGFGLTGMAMLIVILVRGELIQTWQAQLPPEAPNHFVMNILPNDVDGFADFLEQNSIKSEPIYPVVRGRLTHINGIEARQAISKEGDSPEALNRELNLSWSTVVPNDNNIEQGSWWQDYSETKKRVSIESQLAKRLNISLGDELSFFVGNQTFTAHVTSIRSVKWESFHPNFYILFEPGDIDELPHTFLTSFYLPPPLKHLLNPLAGLFPSITLLEVDSILEQVRTIVAQVSAAVEFILTFVLAAGITVTIATLVTTMPERLREGAIMRTLGATRKQLIQQQWSEFFSIGLLSGIVASAGAEAARFAVYQKIFALPYTPSLWIWIIVPLLFGLIIGCAGQFSSHRLLQQSPIASLRE